MSRTQESCCPGFSPLPPCPGAVWLAQAQLEQAPPQQQWQLSSHTATKQLSPLPNRARAGYGSLVTTHSGVHPQPGHLLPSEKHVEVVPLQLSPKIHGWHLACILVPHIWQVHPGDFAKTKQHSAPKAESHLHLTED